MLDTVEDDCPAGDYCYEYHPIEHCNFLVDDDFHGCSNVDLGIVTPWLGSMPVSTSIRDPQCSRLGWTWILGMIHALYHLAMWCTIWVWCTEISHLCQPWFFCHRRRRCCCCCHSHESNDPMHEWHCRNSTHRPESKQYPTATIFVAVVPQYPCNTNNNWYQYHRYHQYNSHLLSFDFDHEAQSNSSIPLHHVHRCRVRIGCGISWHCRWMNE